MFNLNISTGSFQRYLNKMGWEKVRTKYCQAVCLKNYIQISLKRSSCNIQIKQLKSIIRKEPRYACNYFIYFNY